MRPRNPGRISFSVFFRVHTVFGRPLSATHFFRWFGLVESQFRKFERRKDEPEAQQLSMHGTAGPSLPHPSLKQRTSQGETFSWMDEGSSKWGWWQTLSPYYRLWFESTAWLSKPESFRARLTYFALHSPVPAPSPSLFHHPHFLFRTYWSTEPSELH